MTTAVIMAGGEGLRLRPFTHTIPKPLLPIGRKPVAQLIIERLAQCGIHDVIMALGYRSDLIQAFFQSGEQFGVRIRYFTDPTKLGTAGALAYLNDLNNEPFLVTNGDIIADIDYGEFVRSHGESGAIMSVAVREATVPIPYGVVEIEDGMVTRIVEKPAYSYRFNAGIYALSPAARQLVPKGQPFDMTDLINAAIAAGETVRAVTLPGFWFDLARVDDFEKALQEIETRYPHLLS
jgi:NDP-sugar pyrophosphorylase family protein